MSDLDIRLTAELREDRCPRCVPKATELPTASRIDWETDSMVCDYACAVCGYAWFTSWSIGALTGVWPGQ